MFIIEEGVQRLCVRTVPVPGYQKSYDTLQVVSKAWAKKLGVGFYDAVSDAISWKSDRDNADSPILVGILGGRRGLATELDGGGVYNLGKRDTRWRRLSVPSASALTSPGCQQLMDHRRGAPI